jgi:hypothetical protein
MSGIYVLQTKDGFRVNYSELYYCLLGSFNDDTMNYDIDAEVLKRMFGNCRIFNNELQAIESAKGISKVFNETDDGIMMLKYAGYTYEELLNGKANKKFGGS